jgi:hypothetical protein
VSDKQVSEAHLPLASSRAGRRLGLLLGLGRGGRRLLLGCGLPLLGLLGGRSSDFVLVIALSCGSLAGSNCLSLSVKALDIVEEEVSTM